MFPSIGGYRVAVAISEPAGDWGGRALHVGSSLLSQYLSEVMRKKSGVRSGEVHPVLWGSIGQSEDREEKGEQEDGPLVRCAAPAILSSLSRLGRLSVGRRRAE